MNDIIARAAARGITVEHVRAGSEACETQDLWCASIPRKWRTGRERRLPLARMLADTPEGAAQMALTYVGARRS